jgi:hypothetical protein
MPMHIILFIIDLWMILNFNNICMRFVGIVQAELDINKGIARLFFIFFSTLLIFTRLDSHLTDNLLLIDSLYF